ncbi:MAG: hypothetical protein ACPL7A_00840, partial [Anaerolineales bacterium]
MNLNTLISIRQKKYHIRKQNRSIPRVAWSVALGVSLVFTGLIITAVFFSINLFTNLPSIDELTYLLDDHQGVLQQPTRFYARDGNNLLVTLAPAQVERSWLQVTNPNDPSTYLDLQTPLVRAFREFYETEAAQNHITLIFDFFNPNLTTIAQRLAENLLLWR